MKKSCYTFHKSKWIGQMLLLIQISLLIVFSSNLCLASSTSDGKHNYATNFGKPIANFNDSYMPLFDINDKGQVVYTQNTAKGVDISTEAQVF